MKRPEEMTMDEARDYCLKLERDRERSWRRTRQGAFESSFMSIDEHVAKFDDPSKIAAFSDGGVGALRTIGACEMEKVVADALASLSERDRAFAEAVLNGAGRSELGLTRQGFNWKLRDMQRKLAASEQRELTGRG